MDTDAGQGVAAVDCRGVPLPGASGWVCRRDHASDAIHGHAQRCRRTRNRGQSLDIPVREALWSTKAGDRNASGAACADPLATENPDSTAIRQHPHATASDCQYLTVPDRPHTGANDRYRSKLRNDRNAGKRPKSDASSRRCDIDRARTPVHGKPTAGWSHSEGQTVTARPPSR